MRKSDTTSRARSSFPDELRIEGRVAWVAARTDPLIACDKRRTGATVVSMADVASRELRNNTRALLERVEAGEEITITVDGRSVAVLAPVGRKRRWMPREEFVRTVLRHQADPGLRDLLREMMPDTTDDIPL